MKTATLAAVLLLPLAASAQDQGAISPDPNMQYRSSRNPVTQGTGSTPFGFGQTREGRFVQQEGSVDAQTGAQPTDRQGAPNGVREQTPGIETNPDPKKSPASPADKELPAVTPHGPDGPLTDDAPEDVPND